MMNPEDVMNEKSEKFRYIVEAGKMFLKKETVNDVAEEKEKNDKQELIENTANRVDQNENSNDQTNSGKSEDAVLSESGEYEKEDTERTTEMENGAVEFFSDEEMSESDIDELLQTENFVDKLRSSELRQTVLGEDGRFDLEDVERITESAKSAVKNAVDRLKGLFGS